MPLSPLLVLLGLYWRKGNVTLTCRDTSKRGNLEFIEMFSTLKIPPRAALQMSLYVACILRSSKYYIYQLLDFPPFRAEKRVILFCCRSGNSWNGRISFSSCVFLKLDRTNLTCLPRTPYSPASLHPNSYP